MKRKYLVVRDGARQALVRERPLVELIEDYGDHLWWQEADPDAPLRPLRDFVAQLWPEVPLWAAEAVWERRARCRGIVDAIRAAQEATYERLYGPAAEEAYGMQCQAGPERDLLRRARWAERDRLVSTISEGMWEAIQRAVREDSAWLEGQSGIPCRVVH